MRAAVIPSTQPRDRRRDALPQPDPLERRSRVRFPIELRVRFRTVGESYPVSGVGWVVNMSSGGVLVACEDEVTPGSELELYIDWPILLHDRVPIQLVGVGPVVRRELFGFAVGLERYHFKTAGRLAVA